MNKKRDHTLKWTIYKPNDSSDTSASGWHSSLPCVNVQLFIRQGRIRSSFSALSASTDPYHQSQQHQLPSSPHRCSLFCVSDSVSFSITKWSSRSGDHGDRCCFRTTLGTRTFSFFSIPRQRHHWKSDWYRPWQRRLPPTTRRHPTHLGCSSHLVWATGQLCRAQLELFGPEA